MPPHVTPTPLNRPQNLLVSARYEIKVADFGLSRIKDATHVRWGPGGCLKQTTRGLLQQAGDASMARGAQTLRTR